MNDTNIVPNPPSTQPEQLVPPFPQLVFDPPVPKAKPWLTIIALILFASIAGFLFWQNQTLRQELAAQSSPTASATPALSADPTAGWENFTDTKNGYTFRYPKSMGDQGAIAGPYTGISTPVRTFSVVETIREGTDVSFDGFSVYVVTDTQSVNFESYIINEQKAMVESESGFMSGATRKGIQGITNGEAIVTANRGYYYIPHLEDEKVVVFAYSESTSKFKEIFDQILSTFKFTGNVAQIPGWKFFQNEEFIFQYPGEWTTGQNDTAIVADTAGAGMTVFGSDSPMYNECMKLDNSETKGTLLVKYYSYKFSAEACSNEAKINDKEIWITKAGGDGFQPGIIYMYNLKFYPKAENIFQQILTTFQFTN